MAKPCKKCDPHEICEECPEWIFTLADLIMCMMGLFVILWVLKTEGKPDPQSASAQSQQQSQEFYETIGEIRAGFGYVPDPNSSDPVDQAMIRKKMRLVGEGEKGTQEIKQDSPEGTDPQATMIRESKFAVMGGRIEFATGKAELSADAKRALTKVAKDIRGTRIIIMIKGHASRDDFALDASAVQFMDVSIRRAQAVADYLVSLNVSPDILRVQGCSYFEPIQRAYTHEAQQINRRVEVFSTEVTVRELQDTKRGPQAPLN